MDCEIMDGNPKDSNLYEGVLERVRSDYGIRPRDMVSDGAYASQRNQEKAKEYGIVNICIVRLSLKVSRILPSTFL